MSDDNIHFGKRRPPTDLNYDEYKKGNYNEKETENEEVGRQCSESEIAARKILKIRRGGKFISEETAKTAENNAKFTIDQALPTFKKDTHLSTEEPADKTFSFISNGNNASSEIAKPQERSFFNDTNTNNKNNEPVNLFSNNNNNNDKNQSSTNIFAKTDNVQGNANLFNNNNQGNGLFGATTKNQSTGFFNHTINTEKLGNNVSTGLNLFNNNKVPSNLFSNNNDSPNNKEILKVVKEESPKKPESNSGGLFANVSVPSSGLFGNVGKNNSGLFGNKIEEKSSDKKNLEVEEKKPSSLFGNLPSSGVGLFSGLLDTSKSNNTGGTNIFSGNISNTFLKNKDEAGSDGENGEAQNEEDENDENEKEEIVDKSKSTGNYQYNELTEVVHGYEVSNFKVNDIPGYGKGKVTIEKIKEGGNELIIFRNPAKLIMFQGLLVKKMTTADYMRGKDDAIFVVCYTMENLDDVKKTIRNNCKMGFNSVDDSKALLKYLKEKF